jgi:ACT domain-containing protein
MMMMLEMDKQTDFEHTRQELSKIGEALGVKISIQNEEIFEAMHKL